MREAILSRTLKPDIKNKANDFQNAPPGKPVDGAFDRELSGGLMENNGSGGFVMLAVIALGGSGDKLRTAGLAGVGVDRVFHPRVVPYKRGLTKLDGFILFNVWAKAIGTTNCISRTGCRPPFDLFMMMKKRGIHVHDCIPRDLFLSGQLTAAKYSTNNLISHVESGRRSATWAAIMTGTCRRQAASGSPVSR